jgi:hypothetical protein
VSGYAGLIEYCVDAKSLANCSLPIWKGALNDTVNAAFVQVLRKLHYSYEGHARARPEKEQSALIGLGN